ncbi:MAG: hypothetical protein JXA51_05870 [Dehalococcoidales bacterium]|nr:hypothetical protein [Dehalococcoidales bacterium]
MENPSVRCYSGHTYAQEPRAFTWQGAEYEVEAIEKAWQGPGERFFLVSTGGHKRFQLCYNETTKRWSVIEVVRR